MMFSTRNAILRSSAGRSPIWEYKVKKIGITICEDIWQHAGFVGYTDYVCDPVCRIGPKKPDFMLNLLSSPYHFEKPDIRIKVCAKTAKTLALPCHHVLPGGKQ